MRKTILLMPTDPSSGVQRVDAETGVRSAAASDWQIIFCLLPSGILVLTLDL